ncbi:hypothetical protein PUN28_003332 [Cardiocondyla obscurior]
MKQTVVKDFHAVYFVPAIITSMLFLLTANKGLLTSFTWGLTVGSLGTWGVLQLMSTFPYCFTMGEATAVTHSFILFLMSAVTNLPLRYHLPPFHDDDISTVFLQVAMLYTVSLCLLFKYFPVLRSTIYFYLTVIGLLCFVTLPTLYIILDRNPITWIVFFVLKSRQRIALFIYWIICFLLSIFVVIYQISSKSQATSVGRKIFHILATFVYIPGLVLDPLLLYLASGMTLILFIALEVIRLLKVPPLGKILQQGFVVFADKKDRLLSLTPIYLLCGFSLPLWMPTNNLTFLTLLSGVITVGFGDTAASYVGNRWGSHKWPDTKKTIEGTVACVLIQFFVIFAVAAAGFITHPRYVLRSVLAIITISVVEGHINQVDNMALPLSMYVFFMM